MYYTASTLQFNVDLTEFDAFVDHTIFNHRNIFNKYHTLYLLNMDFELFAESATYDPIAKRFVPQSDIVQTWFTLLQSNNQLSEMFTRTDDGRLVHHGDGMTFVELWNECFSKFGKHVNNALIDTMINGRENWTSNNYLLGNFIKSLSNESWSFSDDNSEPHPHKHFHASLYKILYEAVANGDPLVEGPQKLDPATLVEHNVLIAFKIVQRETQHNVAIVLSHPDRTSHLLYPTIVLHGDSEVSVENFDDFVDEGATASSIDYAGDINVFATIDGNPIQHLDEGVHELVYSIEDSNLWTASISRTLNILGSLLGWWDASQHSTLTTDSGNAVLKWKDISGKGFDLISDPNAPPLTTYVQNVINSHPGVQFVNQNHSALASTIKHPIYENMPFTWFLVINTQSTDSAHMIFTTTDAPWENKNNPPVEYYKPTSASPHGIFGWAQSPERIVGAAIPAGQMTVVVITFDGSAINIYHGTSQKIINNTSMDFSTTKQGYVVMGTAMQNHHQWYGFLGEVRVYSEALADDRRIQITNELSQKWS